MPFQQRYKADIPEGYRIFEQEFEIAGTHHRLHNLLKLLKKHALVSMHLQPEPSNKFDPNAIQVVGRRKRLFGELRTHIGYIPAEIASKLAPCKLLSQIMVRPKRIWIGDNGKSVSVKIDLIGPKDIFDEYLIQTNQDVIIRAKSTKK